MFELPIRSLQPATTRPLRRLVHTGATGRSADGPRHAIFELQRRSGNAATARLLSRQRADAGTPDAGSPARTTDPTRYATYEAWLAALPAVPDPAKGEGPTDMTADFRAAEPALTDLVDRFKADCADVSILLRHYYLAAHRQQGTVKAGAKSYVIGLGVSD